MRIRSNLEFPEEIIVYIGGHVHAVNPLTGNTIWKTKLPKTINACYATVVLDGDIVLVGVGGYLHALDKQDGRVIWTNEFKGLGLGMVGIATPKTSANGTAQASQQQAGAQATRASRQSGNL